MEEDTSHKKHHGKKPATGASGAHAGKAAEAPGPEVSEPGAAGAQAPGVAAAEVEKYQAQAREYLGDLKRLQAEFENYKKRMVREQTNFLALAGKDLIEKLLPVLDDLDRAVTVSEQTDDFKKLAEGVHLIRAQLMKALESEGLEAVDPLGEQFDPNHSEAVLQVPSKEHEEHTVAEVLQKGYTLKGRLLRPARVKVTGKP